MFIVPGSEDHSLLLQWRGEFTASDNNIGHFRELLGVMWKYGVDHSFCETDEKKRKYYCLVSKLCLFPNN